MNTISYSGELNFVVLKDLFEKIFGADCISIHERDYYGLEPWSFDVETEEDAFVVSYFSPVHYCDSWQSFDSANYNSYLENEEVAQCIFPYWMHVDNDSLNVVMGDTMYNRYIKDKFQFETRTHGFVSDDVLPCDFVMAGYDLFTDIYCLLPNTPSGLKINKDVRDSMQARLDDDPRIEHWLSASYTNNKLAPHKLFNPNQS